jgi:hypothetical protein
MSEAWTTEDYRRWLDGTLPCENCGLCRTSEKHDPCIANLPGVLNACCGHGYRDGYVHFENGMVLRGRWDHVERGAVLPHMIYSDDDYHR